MTFLVDPYTLFPSGAPPGPTLPTPTPVNLDGSTHQERALAMTGAVPDNFLAVHVDYEPIGVGATMGLIGLGVNGILFFHTGSSVRVQLRNSNNSLIYDMTTIGGNFSSGNPYKINFSFDGTTATGIFNLNGTDITSAPSSANIGDIGFNTSNNYMFSNQGVSSFLRGSMTRVTVWSGWAPDVNDAGVRAIMEDHERAGENGNNLIDIYGPPALWNTDQHNNGTGGVWNTIGTVT